LFTPFRIDVPEQIYCGRIVSCCEPPHLKSENYELVTKAVVGSGEMAGYTRRSIDKLANELSRTISLLIRL